MELMLTMLVPVLMLAIALWGLVRKVDLWSALVAGAGEGLNVTVRIAPPLIALLTAVYMLRASGALELLGQVLEPVLSAVGIPVETIGLVLVRPVSGSAAAPVTAEAARTSPAANAGLLFIGFPFFCGEKARRRRRESSEHRPPRSSSPAA